MRQAMTLLGVAIALGVAASTAAAGTYTFTPTADAQVGASSPLINTGTASRISVDGDPRTESVLRFQPSGMSGTVSSAKLRLYVDNPSADGPSAYRTTGSWSESAVTWSNMPARSGGALADLGAVATATWVELDVTAAVTGNGTYDFLLAATASDGSSYHSRQGTNRPQLRIVTATTPTTPPPTLPPEPPPPSPTPPPPGPTPPPPSGSSAVTVTLQPRTGVTGSQRVNFAVPLAPGVLTDANRVRVLASGVELPAARKALATHPGGSIRSVQLQVQVTPTAGMQLQVRLNEAPTTTALALVAVSTTLDPADGTLGPKVWARLPAAWLSASGVTGPQVPEADVNGGALDAWDNVCDYQNHTVTHFDALKASKDVWLFDRGTAMYRGYARRGDQVTLESAYRETAQYRAGVTGTGTATRISVPGSASDVKYHYTQNLAIHYLLTGDDRFREAAENVAIRMQALWSDPDYAGGDDFWTERHAGFGLLAYVWAWIVTDDKATQFMMAADDATDAYLAMQAQFPASYTDQGARCFAHTATAHGEGYGTWGCSPWMSAILADGLDAYATQRGGADATAARAAVVKLGKILARDGRDTTGRPYYWMGIGSAADVADDYEEHWGESAYVAAMAWFHGGKSDAGLRSAADSLMAGLKSKGTSGHLRSFNWQCRSAVGAAYYLK